MARMAQIDGTELKRLLIACSGNRDKLAAFETLVSLLAARAEAVDDMQPVARIESLDAQIAAAHDELRWMLGELS
jgi:hypothetical protein